jgi:hypothetical protein
LKTFPRKGGTKFLYDLDASQEHFKSSEREVFINYNYKIYDMGRFDS